MANLATLGMSQAKLDELIKDGAINDAKYYTASAVLIDRIDRYATRFYGERCDEYEAGCPICDIWKIRDDMRNFVCD